MMIQMLNRLRGAFLSAVVVFPLANSASAQTPVYRAPRTPDGKPNLNGIWQAINTANWDLLEHAARPALATVPGPAGPIPAPALVPFGAVGAVPGGISVVDG